MNTILNTNLLLATLVVLSACSQDEDKDTTEGEYKEISTAEVALIDLNGTWQQTVEFDIDLPIEAIDNSLTGSDTSINLSGSIYSTTTMFHEENGDVVSKGCDTGLATTNTPETFWSEVHEVFFNEELGSACDSPLEYQLLMTSDDNLQAKVFCEDKTLVSYKLDRLSDTPSFNHGSLSLAGDTVEDFSVSEGVCLGTGNASIMFLGQHTTDDLEEYNTHFSNIDIVAPYRGELIGLSINIADLAQPGTYTINEEEGHSLDIDSDAFDGPNLHYYAESGSISLSIFSETHAKGTFDVVLDNGESLTGSFDVNM